jgi:hypothetical protein
MRKIQRTPGRTGMTERSRLGEFDNSTRQRAGLATREGPCVRVCVCISNVGESNPFLLTTLGRGRKPYSAPTFQTHTLRVWKVNLASRCGIQGLGGRV